MKKEKSIQLFVICIMAVTVIAMGIGFAAFSQTLTISGMTTINTAKWEVIITGVDDDETTATSASYTSTTGTYTVDLSNPGECQKVVYNIKNNGTIDAKLVGIFTSGLTTAQKKYVSIVGNYNNLTTTSNEGIIDLESDPISLAQDNTATLELNVCYNLPENDEDLPTQSQSITLVTSLNYEQVE